MFPWFQYTVVYLGPIPIQVWGLFVALGMLLSVWIVWKRAKRLGENPEQIVDLAFWAIVGGLIGARLFHVVLYQPDFYFDNPVEIIKVWRGGLSSFGGLFGAAVGFLWKARMGLSGGFYRKLFKIADILAFAAVYGWMVGRLGCAMIHDHPGIACNCFLAVRWSDGTPRLDMAILEILAMTPLAIWFYLTRRKRKPDGWFLNVLFIYYGALRFILDFFRATDLPGADARYFGLTPAQYFAILLVVLGGKFFFSSKRHVGRFA